MLTKRPHGRTIHRLSPEGEVFIAAHHDPAGAVPKPPTPEQQAFTQEVTEDVCNQWHTLSAPCSHHDRVCGILTIASTKPAWREDDVNLLSGVADQVGIAIAQAEIQERLRDLSRTDDLTGMLNRRAFAEEVERRIQHLGRTRRDAALVYFDLDNFKEVNDVHGHARGDAVLQELAAIVTGYTRVGDVAARLGGDEFALWLDDIDSDKAAAVVAHLRDLLAPLRRHSGRPEQPLGVSIGIATVEPDQPPDLDSLIARADSEMYRNKRARKERGNRHHGENP